MLLSSLPSFPPPPSQPLYSPVFFVPSITLHSTSFVLFSPLFLLSCLPAFNFTPLHSLLQFLFRSFFINDILPTTPFSCSYQNSLPTGTAVERVTESVETAGFKSGFAEWSAATDFNYNKFNKDAVKKEDQPIDVQHLLALKTLESAPIDDGSGEQFKLNLTK